MDAVRRKAADRAADYAEIITDVRAGGAQSLFSIAKELNVCGILTARGGKWHASTVRNALKRIDS